MPTPEQMAKLRRYQKAIDKVPQRDDGGRSWATLEDKFQQELRKELDMEAEFDKVVKSRTKRELNSLRKMGETEAFGIITIDHVFSIEYYPTLPIRDDDGYFWEFRKAPLRVISLWVKQYASDITQAKADLDRQVDAAVKAIGGMTKEHKSLQAFEKEFRQWCNDQPRERPDTELNPFNFISETGRLNPARPRPHDDGEGRFDDHDEDGVVYPPAE